MSDDFLYRFRRDPPPRFAAQLRAKLGGRAKSPTAPFRTLRVFALGLLSGVAVMASAWFLVDREDRKVEQPTAQLRAAASAPEATRAQPDAPSQTNAKNKVDTDPAAPETMIEARVEGAVGKPRLRIVADATAQLFAVKVADQLRHLRWLRAPLIEGAATSDAIKHLCTYGRDGPDIVIAARRIQADELQLCRRTGWSVTEGLIGYQAVVLTAGKQTAPISLAPADVYLALAREIPDREPGRMIPNPHRVWSSINPTFDPRRIEVTGPAPGSAQGRAMLQLLMEPGCDRTSWVKALKSTDYQRYQRICHAIREDGAYDDAPQSPALVTRLWAEPERIAIVDHNFYSSHRHELASSLLRGAEPTLDAIAPSHYPGARAVYVYAIRRWSAEQQEYLREQFSEYALGLNGYFVREGLLPLDERERTVVRSNIMNFAPLESLQ